MTERSNGQRLYYAKKDGNTYIYEHKISHSQKLNPTDAKVQNLKTAIRNIEVIHVLPGQTFSFWRIVGEPSVKNGYTASRSIVGGRIEASVGGGLCQLSGLIYYLSLMAGLQIIERYNHSVDIYDESTRFTPIGSDATVAYGYKDLKIRNNHTSPIQFTFVVDDDLITIELNHNGRLVPQAVAFEVKKTDTKEIVVQTLVNNKMVTESKYKKPESNSANPQPA
jgi:vancomycin resistance protein VanW